MAFDQENRRELDSRAQEKRHQPHQDVALNLQKYDLQKSYIHWLRGGVTMEICGTRDFEDVQEPDGKKVRVTAIKEPTHILISWKDDRDIRFTMNISLHQPESDFQKQLCGALNKLGSKGFLEHTKKDRLGYYRKEPLEPDNGKAWEQLFGGIR